MRKKWRDAGGMTLVELLCATVILTLLCLMMGAGLRLAVRSLRDITAESELQLLLGSLSDAAADKLSCAVVTRRGAAGTYTYTCSIGELGVDSEGRAVVRRDGTDRKLLPDGAYGENGRYEVSELAVAPAYSGDTATFTVRLAVRETAGTVGAEAEVKIRCLNPIKRG